MHDYKDLRLKRYYQTNGVSVSDDHLYSAILRSLEQTHCARMWFYMCDWLFFFFYSAVFEYPPVVYLQRWHGWCHMKLLPSRRVLCTP